MSSRLIFALVSTLAVTMLVDAGPAEAKARRKPDGYVRLADDGTAAWVGKNEYYTSSPWETSSELEVQGAGTYRFLYRVHNRGSGPDTINVVAARWSTPPAECTYKVVRRGKNITAKITGAGFVERGLAAGDKTTYKVKIGAAGADDNCALEFKASSSKNFAKRDYVIITVANNA